jgi:hypothetical protein
MKTKLLLTTFLSSFCILHSALGQGVLTPPGAPAPTMKTLAQIEPRTPISIAPFTISVAGSYYLTTNVTVSSGDAITITANNVTLDLNGFTIASTAASAAGYAINLSGGRTTVTIANGNISSGVTNTAAGVFGGGGFSYGIYYSGSAPANVRVKNVSVAGVLYTGIYLYTGNSTVVEGCTVNVAGSYGIYADSVADATALNCGSYGIIAGTALNCKGSVVGSGTGLNATTANNCYGSSSGSGTGLYAAAAATSCYGFSSAGTGLYAATIAIGCQGVSSTGTGLVAWFANTCWGQGVPGYTITYKYNMP